MAEEPEKKPEQTPAPQTPETVAIPRAEWEKVLETIGTQQKTIDLLYAAGDRGRIAAIEGKSQKEIPRFVKLSTLTIDGIQKIVVAWSLIKDEVFKASNGAWVENQIVKVVLEDDSVVEMSLVDFNRKTQQKVQARLLSRTSDEHGETMRVIGEDGKERLLSGQFVN